MEVINLSNPGMPLEDSDLVEYRYPNGATERKTWHAPVVPVLSLDEAKVQKIAAIRAHFEGIVSALKADAAPYEIDTWDTQRAEYMAWQANNAAPTPYVSGLAAARGLTVPELMAKIAPKISGLATLQGTQHKLEKLVLAATGISDVDAVVL